MPILKSAKPLRCAGEKNVLQIKTHEGRLRAENFRYAIVASRWNDFLTARLVEGAVDAIVRLGGSIDQIELFKVPGSFEIPMMAQKAAQSKRFDAVICVGTIIRGQTPHFDFIAGEASGGIMNVAMQTGIPVLNGIITADTLEQAIDRAGVKVGNKGFEAAQAAIEMVNLFKAVETLE